MGKQQSHDNFIVYTSIFKLLALLSSVRVRPRPLSAELSPPRRVILDVGILKNSCKLIVFLTKYSSSFSKRIFIFKVVEACNCWWKWIFLG